MQIKELITDLEVFETLGIDDVSELLEKKHKKTVQKLQKLTNKSFSELETNQQEHAIYLFDYLYRIGNPLISDELFDSFEELFKTAKPKYTQKLFEPSLSGWKKEKHWMPMGSLSKCTTKEEIEKWNSKERIKGSRRIVSEKLDGISLELQYEKGVLKKAITRGDGLVGDDIFENAIYFNGIVKELTDKFTCAIRGEVVILKDNLTEINNILISKGKKPMKNTRNAVAGLATKFKNRELEVLELINFIAYNVVIYADTE